MSLTTEREIAEAKTHDSTFTRGFEVGWIQAKIEDRVGFKRAVLASHVETLLTILIGDGVNVRVGRPERGQFGVVRVALEVAFE